MYWSRRLERTRGETFFGSSLVAVFTHAMNASRVTGRSPVIATVSGRATEGWPLFRAHPPATRAANVAAARVATRATRADRAMGRIMHCLLYTSPSPRD